MYGFGKTNEFTILSKIYRRDGQTFDRFQGVGGTVDTLDNIFDKHLEHIFNPVTTKLQSLLENYSLGKFQVVEETMTNTFNEYFSQQMYNSISCTKNSRYQEKIRVLFTKVFEGLQQSVLQNMRIRELELKLKTSQERCSILDDNDKLIEYINKLRTGFRFIEDQKITCIAATLKPEYQKYIDLYGLPEGLVFDTDKLNQIKN